MTDTTQEDIERQGFIRTVLPALAANMAAAHIHAQRRIDWKQLVFNSMEGTKECWKAIKEDREKK